jgi:acetate kinase
MGWTSSRSPAVSASGPAPLREATAAGLGFLGVALDATSNARAVPDTEVGAPASRVRVFVIEAREDAEIARQVEDVLV